MPWLEISFSGVSKRGCALDLTIRQMKKLASPFVVEVYRYDDERNEYIMEYMDDTLKSYIERNNNKLCVNDRLSIVRKFLTAMSYLHSKEYLHRDISPCNILVKMGNCVEVKLSDFGLVKVPDSILTTAGTEFRGAFNDPELNIIGFDKYSKVHEIYAMTLAVAYIMSGRLVSNIKDKKLLEFVESGTNPKTSERYKNERELYDSLCRVVS